MELHKSFYYSCFTENGTAVRTRNLLQCPLKSLGIWVGFWSSPSAIPRVIIFWARHCHPNQFNTVLPLGSPQKGAEVRFSSLAFSSSERRSFPMCIHSAYIFLNLALSQVPLINYLNLNMHIMLSMKIFTFYTKNVMLQRIIEQWQLLCFIKCVFETC